MIRITAAVVGSLLLAIGANDAGAQNAGNKPRTSVDIGFERFVWEEFSRDERLLKEDGVRFTVGLKTDTFERPSPGMIYGLEGRLYLGEVEYDGQTQSRDPESDQLPFLSDTLYAGAIGEALVGQRLGGRGGMDVIAGLGAHSWRREIQGHGVINRVNEMVFVSDTVEDYLVLYSKLGLGIYRIGDRWSAFVHAGGKYPFYIDEYAYSPGISLEPRGEWSGFAQIQVSHTQPRNNSLVFRLSYDSFRFSRSPVVWTGPAEGWYQPDSDMDVISLTVGRYF